MRAMSLQALNFDLDAIDDFDRAILLAPGEANLYHMRSFSREAAGDHEGCVSDLQEAIRLSKIVNRHNDYWNGYAKETGWPSATAKYESAHRRSRFREVIAKMFGSTRGITFRSGE